MLHSKQSIENCSLSLTDRSAQGHPVHPLHMLCSVRHCGVICATVGCLCGCRTYTWIDDVEARPNVKYVLASGSCIAFGEY